MQDFLYRGLSHEGDIRFAYGLTTQVANQAVTLHQCDPLAAHMLCRALSAAVLCSPFLEAGERYSIYWRYQGAVRSVIAEIGHQADVRGLISETSLLQKVDNEGEIYGSEGTISVVRSDAIRQLNSGTTQAGLLDVVEDLAFYFATSDQIETAMTVLIGFRSDPAAPVEICQGMLLQALPGCDLERFDRLRNAMHTQPFRELLGQPPLADNHVERLIQALEAASGESMSPPMIFESSQPNYTCGCSREKTLAVLGTLSAAELQAAIEQGETLTVRCHFCNEAYGFSGEELRRALDKR